MGFGGGDLLDGERMLAWEGGPCLWETSLFRGPWIRTALQLDGTEALHVPKSVAVDFAEVVLVLLRTDVVDTVWEVWEIIELLAAGDVLEVVELLDMAAGWIGGELETDSRFVRPRW